MLLWYEIIVAPNFCRVGQCFTFFVVSNVISPWFRFATLTYNVLLTTIVPPQKPDLGQVFEDTLLAPTRNNRLVLNVYTIFRTFTTNKILCECLTSTYLTQPVWHFKGRCKPKPLQQSTKFRYCPQNIVYHVVWSILRPLACFSKNKLLKTTLRTGAHSSESRDHSQNPHTQQLLTRAHSKSANVKSGLS